MIVTTSTLRRRPIPPGYTTLAVNRTASTTSGSGSTWTLRMKRPSAAGTPRSSTLTGSSELRLSRSRVLISSMYPSAIAAAVERTAASVCNAERNTLEVESTTRPIASSTTATSTEISP